MFPKILGIDAYLVMAIVGFAAGFGLGWIRRKKYGYTLRELLLMFCVIVIGLIIGARTLFAITEIPALINNKFSWEIIEKRVINAGFVFYGGLLGALLGIYILARNTKQDVRKMLNFVVPTFTFFHAFGRIGCLLEGCCYGVESSWGITLAGETVKRLPVQLFEAIGLLIITAILLLLESYNINRGKRFALTPVYLALYAPMRFVLEIYRGDILRGVFNINTNYMTTDGYMEWRFSLSTSQVISLIILGVLAVYVWYSIKTKKNAQGTREIKEETTKDAIPDEDISEDIKE